MKMYNPNDVDTNSFDLGKSKTPVFPTSIRWVTDVKSKLDLILAYMYAPTVNPEWTHIPTFGDILANSNDINEFVSATKEGLDIVLKHMFTGDILIDVISKPVDNNNPNEPIKTRVEIYIEVNDVLGTYNTSAILNLENGKLKELISEQY